jgi:peptide/nickel transport system substrate-binding protein
MRERVAASRRRRAADARRSEARQEVPRREVSRQEAPRQDVPRQQAPRQDVPRQQAPRQDVPRQQAPRQDVPRQDVPRQQAPRQHSPRRRRLRGALAVCGAVTGLALIAACGTGTSAAIGNTPVDGGTASWAMQPATWPNFIFPFTPPNDFSITNTDYFQDLMYRPLYWFGTGRQPTLNTAMSLALPPVYHGHDVTIRLRKNYRWSNGTPVDAQDVVFWMNMMHAEKKNWGGYVPGAFPDNVTSVKATSATDVTMVIKGTFSPLWFTSNELSQITPMPKAWDRTSSGPGSCTRSVTGCPAVYNYLLSQANDTSHYASSPIWGIVDGPWRLKTFNLDGKITFSLNGAYGGPMPAHHITTFVEDPFTTEQAEYNVLQAGGAQKVDVGYLPTVDAPVPPAGATTGANPLPGYSLSPQYAWGLNYIPYDFSNPTVGPIFDQLYFRKAFQYLVDQEGVIDGPLHGYGKVSVGPVGDVPVTKYLSKQALRGDQFSLNPSAASKLLTDNGWHVVPNKQTTCISPGTAPGECGAHIARGTSLSFTIAYASGISFVQSSVKELVSNAAEVGITITPQEGSFDTVTSQLGDCPGATHESSACKWELLDWGSGWSYSPDFLPTGEELFQSGSQSNFGGYTDAKNDELIKQTLRTSNPTAFYKAFYNWENYLAGQLPVVMEPVAPYQLTETAANLHVGIQAPTLMLSPEYWHFVK